MTVLRGPTFLSPGEEPLLVHRFLTWWRDVCHIARSSPREDHHRALAAAIRQVPPDWKRPAGRPSGIWLRTIEADLVPLNFGFATAWRKATTRDEWRHIVDTATLQWSTLWKKKKGEGVIKCRFGSRATNWGPRNWLCGRSSSCSHKVRWAVG